MSKWKKICAVVIVLLFIFIAGFLNRQSTVTISEINFESFYRWGKEFIYIKDLKLLGFDATIEPMAIYIEYNKQKKNDQQEMTTPKDTDNNPALYLNGLQIDYQIFNKNIAIGVDTLCDLIDRKIEYIDDPLYQSYTAFFSMGYSPYWFKKNMDGSISFLPLEESVNCDMGIVENIEIFENVQKFDMQKYFSLSAVMEAIEATYAFKNNYLQIETYSTKDTAFWKKENVVNNSTISYPILLTEVNTTSGKKISACIDRGVLKINLEEFAKIYGFNCNKEYNGDFEIFFLTKMY